MLELAASTKYKYYKILTAVAVDCSLVKHIIKERQRSNSETDINAVWP